MLESFLVVAGQVATLFLLIGAGFVLAKVGALTPEGTSQMSTLALYVATPCIIIHSFEQEREAGMAETLLLFLALYTGCTLLGIVFFRGFFRGEPLERRAPLYFGSVYGNNGFMGMPLVISVLGSESAIFGAMSMLSSNLLVWTHGYHAMGGKVTLRSALVNPATVGASIGLCCFFTGWRPPVPVDDAISFLADLNTPIPMLILGAQMARTDLRSAFTERKIYLAAALRLLAAPLAALLLLLPLRLDPMSYCACVVLAAVPPAGSTAMFSQKFHHDTALAAQTVSAVTLMSMATLPVFAVAAQRLSGLV